MDPRIQIQIRIRIHPKCHGSATLPIAVSCLPEVPLVCLLRLHEPEEEGEKGLPHLPLWDKAHLQQRAHQGRNQLRRIYKSLRYSDRDLIKYKRRKCFHKMTGTGFWIMFRCCWNCYQLLWVRTTWEIIPVHVWCSEQLCTAGDAVSDLLWVNSCELPAKLLLDLLWTAVNSCGLQQKL